MVRKKEKECFVTRREADFIWDQVRIALEKLNRNQMQIHSLQVNIVRNPDNYRVGSAM